jgi:hypothetical protein
LPRDFFKGLAQHIFIVNQIGNWLAHASSSKDRYWEGSYLVNQSLLPWPERPIQDSLGN